jgi:hypothetical protein
MTRLPRSLPIVASLVLLGPWTAACTSYRVESAPAPMVVAEKRPKSVLLTLRSDREVELFGPVVVGDSLRGHDTPESVLRRTVALADIQTIRTRRFNPAKSLLFVLAIGGGVVAYELLMSLNSTVP